MKRILILVLVALFFVSCNKSINLKVNTSNNENYLYMYTVQDSGWFSSAKDAETFKSYIFNEEDFIIKVLENRYVVYSNKRLMYTEENNFGQQ